MRLLNVYTKKFSEFDDKRIPAYIITSHRWCDDEARFKDFHESENRPSEGLKKVEGFCRFVRDENTRRESLGRPDDLCQWIWLDTVCINKDSDAEVTESINSMFRWYRRAQVCFAYLIDVRPLSAGRAAVLSDFQRSNWFTRGWTLQELIAPRQVVFLTCAWEVIGMTRGFTSENDTANLGNLIEGITGIPRHVFGDRERFHLESLTLAERSKWIQRRETTKIEDIAYCLLGILGVNMPLVYGERSNAWRRLEDELSKKHRTDISLPKPDALNKRNSGQEFPFWFRPLQAQAPRKLNNDGLGIADVGSEASPAAVVEPVNIPTREKPASSRTLSSLSPPIPGYHPDKLGEGLLNAAADGDESKLSMLLERGADLSYRDRSGLTALHHASLQGHETTAKLLFAAGADVNAQSLKLGTPLCLSALRGQVSMIKLLLASNASVNEAGRWTGTPLHCASWSGSIDAVRLLLEIGADVTLTSTIWADFLERGSQSGSDAAATTGDLTRRRSECSHQIFDCQPVVIAAHRRQEEIVELMVGSGFPSDLEHRFWVSQKPDEESFEDMNEDDRCTAVTTLMAASWKGPHTLLGKLLDAEASVNKRDSWGRSALWIAAQSGQLRSVQVLVEAGAELNAVSRSGKSALHLAIEIGHAEIVKHLIGKGADVDRADHDGRTACHFAALKSNVEILEELFSRNARYSSQDKYGLTPLHLALQSSNNIAAVECLIRHHANPLAPDHGGRTPLHYAAKRGSSAVLLLLDAGADAAIEDSEGHKASVYLPEKAPDEIRRRLTPTPFTDEFPRNPRSAWPSPIKNRVDTHGRSLSDSSIVAVGNSSGKNSQGIRDMEMEMAIAPVRVNTYRPGSV